jgi:hypothetical protein
LERRATLAPTSSGQTLQYCSDFIPDEATNIWWTLITVAGGTKPSSQVTLGQTLRGVSLA